MEKIKLGEYVRTPEEGYIGKLVEIIPDVLNYYKIDVGREIRHCDNSFDNYIYSRDGFGLKHSPNIIDLIEEGDYVNGKYVYSIGTAIGNLPVINHTDGTFTPNNRIKSIVTKEQFNSIKYTVEEINQ